MSHPRAKSWLLLAACLAMGAALPAQGKTPTTAPTGDLDQGNGVNTADIQCAILVFNKLQENTACSDEAEVLIEKISTLYDREKIYLSRMTPVIGTHTGPGLLFVAVLGEKKSVDSEVKKALPG